MKNKLFPLIFSLLLSVSSLPAQETNPSGDVVNDGLPYVYTNWEHFTEKDGLPNEHIFAMAVDGPYLWIGTENGLARLDKRTREIKTWNEEDGLPWRVVSSLALDPNTGELWVGMFGGGLARLSGGRFDHFHQLNSGLVNDVVYGVAMEGRDVWIATTAGASRYNTVSGEWAIYTEKNAPMEEIWNYGVSTGDGKVFLGIWGSGVLEYDVATDKWKDYIDPDGEMEIDLYRDDGVVHVITTGTSYVDKILWVSSYFGACRYDGSRWRGFYKHDSGLASDFINAVAGRSADEAWYCTDKGVGVITDFKTNTWVKYTRESDSPKGTALIMRDDKVLKTVSLEKSLPHNYALWATIDGDDVWVGTSKGLARATGNGYYKGLKSTPPE